ncbi:MAG: hypothetical protein ACKV2Q_21535 [Planctomycetaceae bacterium]
MPYYEYLWTDEIIEHLAEHDLTPEDFEDVVGAPNEVSKSRSTGADCCWGETADGRYLFCVYDLEDDGITVIPRSAYEVRQRGE